MTKQEVHELLVDYIDYHAKNKNINDDQYFKMKSTARIYAKGHLEKVESSSRIISESGPKAFECNNGRLGFSKCKDQCNACKEKLSAVCPDCGSPGLKYDSSRYQCTDTSCLKCFGID